MDGGREDLDWYVIRCVVCHHKMGHTDNPRETQDVCERCED